MFSGRKCKTRLAILDKLWYYIRAKRTPRSRTARCLKQFQVGWNGAGAEEQPKEDFINERSIYETAA